MHTLPPPRRITMATLMADPTWLRCVQEGVNPDHLEIQSFRDRQQALQFIDSALPEIVALGLGVPEFDALGTLDQLLGGMAKVRMAILTLPDCRNNAIEVTRHGPSDYKTRPLSVRELCDRLWSMRYVIGQ
jgi:DNA-binding response OmpR family regulator